jgi:hypothetical protein
MTKETSALADPGKILNSLIVLFSRQGLSRIRIDQLSLPVQGEPPLVFGESQMCILDLLNLNPFVPPAHLAVQIVKFESAPYIYRKSPPTDIAYHVAIHSHKEILSGACPIRDTPGSIRKLINRETILFA